jgi:uncharacterized RDD family membrane protein YckC
MHEEAGNAVAEVVTGEAVVLEVPCARFPSRLLALALDLLIQVILLFALFVIVGLAVNNGAASATAGAIALTVTIAIVVGYPVLWETLTRGGTPGKFALGLRVVSDDGGPERFRQALVRGLAAVVEIWLLLGCPALICSLLSERGKRLGDVFAGTFVIQQRLPAGRNAATLPATSPELAQWGASLEMSGLTDQTAETARRYLARLPELTPAAQAELGERIAGAVRGQVSPLPPPGTPAVAYLSTVLAERRNRERARLAVSPACGAQERDAPGRGSSAQGSPASGGTGPTGPRRGGESPPRAGSPGPEEACGAATRAAREREPEHIPPASGAGGFVPPA